MSMHHHHRHKGQGRPPSWPPPEGTDQSWSPEWEQRRRFFMRRFIGVFLFAAVFFALLIVGIAMLLSLAFRERPIGPAEVLILMSCMVGAMLGLVLLIGGLMVRRVGSPLAGLMAAADAVAAGDLSVRVQARGRGNMTQFVERFNRMIAELERAEQSRRNLTADVAHELRTPLHILQGNIEGVIDGVYEPTTEHMAAMLDETKLLVRLVDDLQTLSSAEAGELPLHRQTLPAADLLEDVATRFAAAAADAGVILKVHPGDGLPEVNVDPDRLDQALSNLVANALRHTPAGGRITLSAERAAGGVELVVADTGAGIDAADLPFIFDRFWRGDRARGRGGSGLGLPIARRLVEAHGGAITVDSVVGERTRGEGTHGEGTRGEGARFVIWLPGG